MTTATYTTRRDTILESELKTSYASFLKAVLAHDGSLTVYNLEAAENGFKASAKPSEKPSGLTLAEVAKAYTNERKIGQAWSARTGIEKEAHFKLLEEVLGPDIQIRSLNAADAKRVKDILLAYPKNRDKNPLTRGKPDRWVSKRPENTGADNQQVPAELR